MVGHWVGSASSKAVHLFLKQLVAIRDNSSSTCSSAIAVMPEGNGDAPSSSLFTCSDTYGINIHDRLECPNSAGEHQEAFTSISRSP